MASVMVTVDFEEYESVHLCNVCAPSGSPLTTDV